MMLLSGVAALLGVASHIFYFNRGEHHLWSPTYLQLFTASAVGSIVALTKLYGFTLSTATSLTFNIAASYLCGTYTSLIVYRVWRK